MTIWFTLINKPHKLHGEFLAAMWLAGLLEFVAEVSIVGFILQNG